MYYIIYGPLYLLSLLPMKGLYMLSDFFSFLFFRILGYRRKVIEGNLLIAFPEKTGKERKTISRQFHRNFTDTIFETIKSFSASKKFYDKRISVDLSLFDEFAAQGISCQMHACHQFNWEWVSLHWSIHMKQPVVVVYMPASNESVNKVFYNLRTKFGAVYLPATNSKTLFSWRKKLHSLVLIADQKPGSAGSSYWLNFFGKPTPFITGPEKNAALKKCPVIFGKASKPARGKYHNELVLACRDASLLKEGELTVMYRDFIEEAIRAQPAMYLWSHKRFKYEWEEGYRHLWIDNKPI